MLTEEKLLEAIAECWGEREPNANTCYKLAAYYTILNEIRGKMKQRSESYSTSYSLDSDSKNIQRVVDFNSESEFAEAIRGMSEAKAWSIMDELMSALYVINQPFYEKVMRRIKE